MNVCFIAFERIETIKQVREVLRFCAKVGNLNRNSLKNAALRLRTFVVNGFPIFCLNLNLNQYILYCVCDSYPFLRIYKTKQVRKLLQMSRKHFLGGNGPEKTSPLHPQVRPFKPL